MTPVDMLQDLVAAAQASARRGSRPPSVTARLIKADSTVAVLDKSVIAHARECAPALRILQQLMRSDAVDRDCLVPADDGGAPLTFDDFENALLTVAMSVSALDAKRRTAVES